MTLLNQTHCHPRPSIALAMQGEGDPGGKDQLILDEPMRDCANQGRHAIGTTLVPFPRARMRARSPGMTIIGLIALVVISTTVALAQPATLIKHGRIFTVGDKGTLADSDVLIQNGKIAAVGQNLAVPPGAKIIEAHGYWDMLGMFQQLGILPPLGPPGR